MSIVLSASVRQNLLSLQSTADLLSTTQSRLATGKKVNTALDNPTNYFTAASLDSRASDINNLLDGIGNGVQVLQAANTGITSLQKLVDSAKSVANQALQTTVGYSEKSTVTSAVITGATANNLLGPAGNPTDATFTGALRQNNLTAAANITNATELATATNADTLTAGFSAGDTITVNGQTLTFMATGTASGANQIDVTDNVGQLLAKIDGLSGGTGSTVTAGQVVLHTGTTSDLSITSSNTAALGALGLGTGVTQARTAGAPPALQGQTLTIASTAGGTATNITFGTAAGQVNTLDELNAELAKNNLQATISEGKITITTSNDAASATIGAIGGTATPFASLTPPASVQDAAAQLTRANLVSQYNNIIQQITTTAQDASFNGVNLLNGDTLKLVFNETGKSTLSITGVTFNPAGLGLAELTKGTDFIDNNATNKVLEDLNSASSALRSQASTLGSNLSIVQIRQDFSKNLINVLQTGSSNLTLADTNEEAANSQALSTRQSIAVSALALANQSQQSVLQLLR
ncbi:flagellin [Bradyrhizobium sp. LHD-71]|uniref:flagellin N-terminal helical domain-containing protein n=1 Tax=Bradyrhizobium sp. LHD-71 TaxID=3072141 RepID=UPI00280E81B1|nr:flagellin [Bradyrhizobium sp. LHD-71]MDQ8732595.1 flagellin [Bradyrhizobium sp. LHD-71]